MFGRKSVAKDLNPGLDFNKRSSRKRKRNLEDVGRETETKRVKRGESTPCQEEAGPSNSEQVEVGPSSSEQVEASPANRGQGLTGLSNTGQGVAGTANRGQELIAPPNTDQGLAGTGPANRDQELIAPPNTEQEILKVNNLNQWLADPASMRRRLNDPVNPDQGLTGPLGERLDGPAEMEQKIRGLLQRGVFVWDSFLGRPRGTTFGPIQPVPGVDTLPFDIPPIDEPWPGRSIPGTSMVTPEQPGPIEVPSLVNTPGSSPPEEKIPEGKAAPPGDGADGMDIF